MVSWGTILACEQLGIEVIWARQVGDLINAEQITCPVSDDCDYFRNIYRMVRDGYVLKSDGFDDGAREHGAENQVDDDRYRWIAAANILF